MNSRTIFATGLLLPFFVATASAETVWLDELDLFSAEQGWGTPHRNISAEGNPIRIAGQQYAHGFGTHAVSILTVQLNGTAEKFSALVGVDDEVKTNREASVEFLLEDGDKTLWKSGVMHAGDAARPCEVSLAGVKRLVLEVSDAGDGRTFDHADWAQAAFEMSSGRPVTVPNGPPLPPVAPYVLTPPAPATPRINSPGVFGARPGSPFLFTIAATGNRPMTFSADDLPEGLFLNATNGQITGSLKSRGEFSVTLHAKNALGEIRKKFRIVSGDQIALTPPMGWNSWNCFAGAVTEENVKSAADVMVKSGLINHGWTYINVDDYWQNHKEPVTDPTLHGPFRDAEGDIVPNARFPDMPGLTKYIHDRGLKAGIYSSPGPWTCGSCEGSWLHEAADAATYANWGFDYLKYDWCSYGKLARGDDPAVTNIPHWTKVSTDDAGAIYPYRVMGDFIAQQKRDIVFSLCQYGNADVWKWGGSVHGNCWRTTGDIVDTWHSMSNIGFHQEKAAPYAKPGNWNDPDMLIIGIVGWGHPHASRLTVDEQYTHVSLWCLLSAPLLIGCDLTKLDDFTYNLLSNDEVLAIDQDALGKEATCVITNGDQRVYEKTLEDGGHAVGFFNLGFTTAKVDFKQFSALGLAGTQHVRDLWRQKDLADVHTARDALPLTIPPHGVLLYKFTTAN